MSLFHRNPNESNFAGGSKNVMESIQREHDTNTLIYLDSREDFNTNSVITVAPNEQVIFIQNGEFYGTLPSGRHEIKTANYPVLSKIRNMLTGGMSTFTCQVYHVSTSEQNVKWGTASPIEIQDFFLGNGQIGVPTKIRGAAEFRVCFNVREDDDACKQTFMRLMGDKSTFTVDDLSKSFDTQFSQEISSVVGETLENLSYYGSINAISRRLREFAEQLTPYFKEIFKSYGFDLVNFSFRSLTIEESEERNKILRELMTAGNVGRAGYLTALGVDLLNKVAENPNSGGLANAGAGIGMGMAAGNTISQLAASIFGSMSSPQQSQPQSVAGGFGGQNRFGVGGGPQTSSQSPLQTPPQPSLRPQQPVGQTNIKDVLEDFMTDLCDEGIISKEQRDVIKKKIRSNY